LSLEEIEKELMEAELEEKKKGFKLSSIVLGYLAWLLFGTFMFIASNPALYQSMFDLPEIILDCAKLLPRQGSYILDSFLNGDYTSMIMLLLPIVAGGIIAGLISGKVLDGILAGFLVWVIGIIVSLVIIVIPLGSFDLDFIIDTLLGYITDSLFIDTWGLIIFGAIGGALKK